MRVMFALFLLRKIVANITTFLAFIFNFMKVGQQYILDVNFNNTSVVTLIRIYRELFGRVRDDDGNEWDLMLNRLSEL